MSQKIRGVRSPIPSGYVLGRVGTGKGDVGLVKISDYSTKAYVQQVMPTGADPSAVAGDTVIVGTATTYMRSDAAPPVQLAGAAQFGIVKGSSTISITSGVATIPNSVALPGSPTTTTQAPGDSSTKIATTAFVAAAVSGGGGGGAMLPLVNGDLPGPALVADANGQCIGVLL